MSSNMAFSLTSTLIQAWTSKHMPKKVWDETTCTYPFPIFTIKVWEWINNFTPHFIMDAII